MCVRKQGAMRGVRCDRPRLLSLAASFACVLACLAGIAAVSSFPNNNTPPTPTCEGRMVVFAGMNDSDPQDMVGRRSLHEPPTYEAQGTILYNRVRNAPWMCSQISKCPCEEKAPHPNGGTYGAVHCAHCNGGCLNALTVGHMGGYKEWHDTRAVWYGRIGCPIPEYCPAPYAQRGVVYTCEAP